MTPIEVMAGAIDEQITSIYGSPGDKGEAERMARAALLALAKCDLPPSVLKAGAQAIFNDDRYGGGRDVRKARDSFSAMLRALSQQTNS